MYNKRFMELQQDDDGFYEDVMNRTIDSMTRPFQSEFKVVCVIVYNSTSKSSADQFVVGVNTESFHVCNSLCAERHAIAELSRKGYCYSTSSSSCIIKRIYITSDSDAFIYPGTLCREFLCSVVSAGTSCPVVLYNRISQKNKAVDLHELYPYPSIYCNLSSVSQLALGKSLEKSQVERVAKNLSSDENKLYQLVLQAATLKSSSRHPIQYAAGVLFNDGTTYITHQSVALEYGASIDAVIKLIAIIEQQQSEKSSFPVLLIQTDQFGVCHAPFSSARAYFKDNSERFSQCETLSTQDGESGEIQRISSVTHLSPCPPDGISFSTCS